MPLVVTWSVCFWPGAMLMHGQGSEGQGSRGRGRLGDIKCGTRSTLLVALMSIIITVDGYYWLCYNNSRDFNKKNNNYNNYHETHNWQKTSWFKDKNNVFMLISIHLSVSLHKTKKKSSKCWLTWTDLVSFVCKLYVLFHSVTDNKEYDAYLYYTKVDFNSLYRSVISD